MKYKYLYWLLLFATLLVSCNNEGLAGFSPQNAYVAVITRTKRLFATSLDGTVTYPIHTNTEILTGFDITFDPTGERVLYAALSGSEVDVCIAEVLSGKRNCPVVTLPENTFSGFLSYLPNGQFVVAYKSGEQWNLRVYDGNGELDKLKTTGDIDHIFLSADAYKVKRATGGKEWYLTPYFPGSSQALRWVAVQGGKARLYTAADTLQGPVDLATVNPLALEVMKSREETDITSGVVSPDGKAIALRTKGADDLYDLYLVDLTIADSPPMPLVNGANFRLQYDFSPDGSQLVFESNNGGRSLWVVNADGGNPHLLAENASLPDWH